ncbi:hypothetical protein ACOMHN_054982 [Nucella lapillus]
MINIHGLTIYIYFWKQPEKRPYSLSLVSNTKARSLYIIFIVFSKTNRMRVAVVSLLVMIVISAVLLSDTEAGWFKRAARSVRVRIRVGRKRRAAEEPSLLGHPLEETLRRYDCHMDEISTLDKEIEATLHDKSDANRDKVLSAEERKTFELLYITEVLGACLAKRAAAENLVLVSNTKAISLYIIFIVFSKTNRMRVAVVSLLVMVVISAVLLSDTEAGWFRRAVRRVRVRVRLTVPVGRKRRAAEELSLLGHPLEETLRRYNCHMDEISTLDKEIEATLHDKSDANRDKVLSAEERKTFELLYITEVLGACLAKRAAAENLV